MKSLAWSCTGTPVCRRVAAVNDAEGRTITYTYRDGLLEEVRERGLGLGARYTYRGRDLHAATRADGTIEKMVEYKDASEEERALGLCNSGLMAVRSVDLWPLLARVRNDNAAGEFYLPDIVMLAAGDGRASVVIEVDPGEVEGVNSRAELAAMEAAWQQRRRAEMMAEGVSLIAPETVWFSHDTRIGRDTVIEPNVVFGPGVAIGERVTVKAFSHLEGARIADGAQIGIILPARVAAEASQTRLAIGREEW